MFLKRLLRAKPLPADEMQLLIELENKFGYCFRDILKLKKALSHKSFINENKLSELDHNERLEFLGDAVLELGISDMLMEFFPNSREGEMSKLRASIVNETALSEVARSMNLGRYIFLGKGEDQCEGREKNSLLADALEAILGAIFLDGGFNAVYRITRQVFSPIIKRATREDINRDYKTKLQEEIQNTYKVSPQYRLVSELGPDHDKTFEIHLYIAGKKVGEGMGKSKKTAEQNAAFDALGRLDQLSVDLTKEAAG